MKRAKLTAWYPPEIKPVRKGLYQCARCMTRLHIWTGEHWESESTGMPFRACFRWRGLTRHKGRK